jgi:hypothetical protein
MLSAPVPGPLPCGVRTSVSGVRQSSRRNINRLFLSVLGGTSAQVDRNGMVK